MYECVYVGETQVRMPHLALLLGFMHSSVTSIMVHILQTKPIRGLVHIMQANLLSSLALHVWTIHYAILVSICDADGDEGTI